MGKKLEILDCTIRDGGYLNNWYFDLKFVRELYRAHSRSGIDYVEIGFKSTDKYFDPDEYGIWKFSPEPIVSEVVKGISGPKISLMVDFGKIDIQDIPDKKDSIVNMYRVAAHKDKVLQAVDFCEAIFDKGYISSIQLMGIVNYEEDDYEPIIAALKNSNIDYVYFADSYGSLFPTDMGKILNRLGETEKKIGFHAHNNMQLAFATTIEAIRNGIDIIDGTAYGMGRGAGNLPIELLLSYLEKTSEKNGYNTLPVLDVIDRYLLDFHKDLNWGYDLSYMLSGIFEVHSSYSKTMVDYREYSIDDILLTLKTVKKLNPVGFKKTILDSIVQSGFVGKSNNETVTKQKIELCSEKKKDVTYLDRHRDRDFLVLASGPSLKNEKDQVNNFIQKYNPIVIGCNYLGGLYVPHYHAFSNRRRFIDYVDSVDSKSQLLISHSFSEELIKEYTSSEYELIHHLNQISSSFDISNGYIMNNCRTISILSIAVAIVMGARRIFIAGMDGYKHVDSYMSKTIHFYKESDEADDFEILMEKHNWNEKLLKQIDNYLIQNHQEGICILTQTSHRAFYKSIDNFI